MIRMGRFRSMDTSFSQTLEMESKKERSWMESGMVKGRREVASRRVDETMDEGA